MLRQHVKAFAVFGVTWALCGATLALLKQPSSDPLPVVQVVVVGLSMLGSTAVRCAVMRAWIFRTAA